MGCNPYVQEDNFGIFPEIWGTLYSSLPALLIGGFFGVTVAIFLTQDFLPLRIALVFRTIIDMLAAIPSVVFGLWGIFVVIPAIRPIANWLNDSLGWIPFFSTSLSGPGLMPATLVLAIMILPTVAAISQDALNLVRYRTKEAAYGMGTTRWEAILKVMVPTAAGGIASAMVLGFGRALGETMALAMLTGNSNQISLSLFAQAQTLASLLASHFPEAGQTEVQALMYAALVLLAITLVVNMMGHRHSDDYRAQDIGALMSERTAPAPLMASGGAPLLGRSWTERRALRSSSWARLRRSLKRRANS